MVDCHKVIFAREPALGMAEFRRVLVESGLGATRPVNDEIRLQAMLSAASLIVTARPGQHGGPLAGVARCITDFAWCCYVCELAVSAAVQGTGIGRGLLAEIRRQLGPDVSVILAAVPDAVGFYERLGMERLPDAFSYRRAQ